MKIAYFGYDLFHACLLRLMDDGHDIVKIFTFPTDNRYNFNAFITEMAQVYAIPLEFSAPTPEMIQGLRDEGVELFISCGYRYKIPVPDDDSFRGINLHPALLPAGRGGWPLHTILLEHPEAAGLTFHKLSEEWDAGDILLQKSLLLTSQDDLESYSARLMMAAPDLLSVLMSRLETLWQAAQPQDEAQASFYPMPSDDARTFDFSKTIAEIDQIGKAFGQFESLYVFETKKYWVKKYSVWKERHDYRPGSLVCRTGRERVIAAADGFVCLKDFYEAT